MNAVKASVSIPFIHYSGVKDLTTLDPAFFNSNDFISSAEADRVKLYNAPLRVYGYTYREQRREAGLGIHKYNGVAKNVYDINKDVLGFKKVCWRFFRRYPIDTSEERFSFLENYIQKRGFDGYYVDAYRVVAMFIKTEVVKCHEDN